MAFYNSKKVLRISSTNAHDASVLLEGVNQSFPIWTIGNTHNSTIVMLTIALTTNSLVSVETRRTGNPPGPEQVIRVTMTSTPLNSTEDVKDTEKVLTNN